MTPTDALWLSTAVCTGLAGLVWAKTRNFGFLVGSLLIYYFSLYGAWSVIQAKTKGGDTSWAYLEDKMFVLQLSPAYTESLLLYGLFLATVLAVLIGFAKRPSAQVAHAPTEVRIWPLVALGAVALLGSFAVIRGSLAEAAAMNASAYTVSRSGEGVGGLFTVHQTLNRVALFAVALGLVLRLSGREPRLLVPAAADRLAWWGLGALAASLVAFLYVLGNKNELVTISVAMFLLYLANARRVNVGGTVGFVAAGLMVVGMIDVIRGVPLPDLVRVMQQLGPTELMEAAQVVGGSNERIAAHVSLYGVISQHVPLTFGTSVLSLAASVVPRALWPDRPVDVYAYYIDQLGIQTNQGLTVHHVTGWYLNFGIAGVLMGGLVLGSIWVWLSNRQTNGVSSRPVSRAFFAVAPCMLIGSLPPLMRGGIETYKGLLVDGALVPWLVLFVAVGWTASAQRQADAGSLATDDDRTSGP